MSDPFRTVYRQLTDDEKLLVENIKGYARDLHNLYERFPTVTRELSIAKTKLEESVMWAVKHISGSKETK